MSVIRVGTSSWADQRLLASGWYPRSANTPAGRLAHYSGHFDLVEADTSFHAIPAVETTQAWADRTPVRFTFDVKAYGLLTGHRVAAQTLPADLRPAAGGHLRWRDLDPEVHDELWVRFRAALDPIAAAGKLGVVLLQLPPWLVRSDAATRRILDAAERCRQLAGGPVRLAVELRHSSWFGEHTLDTLRLLQRHDLSYVCVDMPQGLASSVPPVLVVTADPAVIRFHGHGAQWAAGNKQDKPQYAYRDRELVDWAQRLHALARDTTELHALFDNCCGDQAVRDAARLTELLGDGQARTPIRQMRVVR
ncbi:DUF72 domain-containing protein [Micromonospora sp. NBC_01813]|uniref:DUF72 domain-containing protein n=1 Tax=Micromonospora sp. NBC_01813 TaxID=2975988 RepID=UPI002DD7D507|nr:DUF72 domain-containing protein [Micromonospora sp. NBC_01813]WSA08696.1 DUF72 domain-containing protein [Micromonospora sp. NBC_01813]